MHQSNSNDEQNSGDLVEDVRVAAQTVKRPVAIPHFDDNDCRMNVHEADSSNAVIGRRLIDYEEVPSNSSSVEDLPGEEPIACEITLNAYQSPSSNGHEPEDRVESRVEHFDKRKSLKPVEKFFAEATAINEEEEECDLEEPNVTRDVASVAYGARGKSSANTKEQESKSKTPPQVIGVNVLPPTAFIASPSVFETTTGEELLVKAATVNRRSTIDESFGATIAHSGIEFKPNTEPIVDETIESVSSDEEHGSFPDEVHSQTPPGDLVDVGEIQAKVVNRRKTIDESFDSVLSASGIEFQKQHDPCVEEHLESVSSDEENEVSLRGGTALPGAFNSTADEAASSPITSEANLEAAVLNRRKTIDESLGSVLPNSGISFRKNEHPDVNDTVEKISIEDDNSPGGDEIHREPKSEDTPGLTDGEVIKAQVVNRRSTIDQSFDAVISGSGIEFTKNLNPVPDENVDRVSLDDEREAEDFHDPRQIYFGTSPSHEVNVMDDKIEAKVVPRKQLDDKILQNDLFSFEKTPEVKNDKDFGVDEEEEIIIPQRRVSTKFSAGAALKSLDQPSPEKEAQPGNVAPAAGSSDKDANAAPETLPPKPKSKSKGFFSFFKRSPKKKEPKVTTGPEAKEKSKSLPKNLKVNEGKPEETKRSSFSFFGSRERHKSDKAVSQDKAQTVQSSNTPATLAVTTTTTTASGSPSKSNIRVFEIMGKNGVSPQPEDSQRSLKLGLDPHDEGLIRLDSSPVTPHAQKEPKTPDNLGVEKDLSIKLNLNSPSVTANAPKQPGGLQVQDHEGSTPVCNLGSVSTTQTSKHPVSSFSQYLVVVAIDFGTTFSGYAFSFIRDPDSIHMMARWEGGDPGIINQKTPTILLLTPEKEFHSFGFAARNHYHDLSPEESLSWHYFDNFKMSLYKSPECSRQTTIVAANGQEFPALEAVRMTLGFFQSHALTELSEQCGTQIYNEDVRWIVTVPAIWTAPAKQFMRVAAYEAKLASPSNPDQLVIALEPEAASVHIRRLRLHQLVPDQPIILPLSVRKPPEDSSSLETVSSQFKTVSRYMVVDCGGGTVDITVHDVNAVTGLLQEVYKATGGPYGSCGIDADFETLLGAIFGEDFIRSFRRNRPSGWVGLMLAFESRKRAASPFKLRHPLNVALPFSFIDYHKKTTGIPVEKAIADFGEPGVRWSSQGMLRLAPEAMHILFQTTVDNIKESVAAIFAKVSGIQHIFLVGGLSESPIVQQAIREEFSRQSRIIVPQDANLAVLKGAVCYGLDPGVVAERRSKLTYGASVLHRFVPGKHPESKRIHRDGSDWCKDILDRFVVANQIVRSGETIVRCYTPASASQKHISVMIYSSEDTDVEFVTDPRVSKCAAINLDLTSSKSSDDGAVTSPQRRKIQTYMTFADTEIKVTAVDSATGEKVNSSIDFLSI